MTKVIEIPKWLFPYITFALFVMYVYVVKDVFVWLNGRRKRKSGKSIVPPPTSKTQ